MLPQYRKIALRTRRYLVRVDVPKGKRGKGHTRIEEAYSTAQHGSWKAAHDAAEKRMKALC